MQSITYTSIIIGACVSVTPDEALALKAAAAVFNARITGQVIPEPSSPLAQIIADKAMTVRVGQGVFFTDHPEALGDASGALSPVLITIDGHLACFYTDGDETDGESVARFIHGFLAATGRNEIIRMQAVTCEQLRGAITDVRVESWVADRKGIKRVTLWQVLPYEEEFGSIIEAMRDPEALARFGLNLIEQIGLPKSLIITSHIDTPIDIDFAQAAQNLRRVLTMFDNFLAGCADPVVAERKMDLQAVVRVLAHIDERIHALDVVEA